MSTPKGSERFKPWYAARRNLKAQVSKLVSDNGGLFCTNDIATMYQDSEGTIPVTAAGQSVALWRDQSDNGHDLSQSVVLSQPLLASAGGRDVVSFDGVDDTLTGLAAVTLSQPNTICLAVRVNDASVGRPLISGTSPDRNNISVNASNQVLGFAGGTLTDTTTSVTIDTPYVFTVVFNGGEGKIRVNGTETASGGIGAEGLTGLSLAFGGTNYSDVEFYGVAFFDGLLNSSELSIVEAYMAGLTV